MIFALKNMQLKVATCYLFCSHVLGPVYPGLHQTLSSLLFCFSCGLLFQIMNDGTTKYFLKYEKAVILFNFSSIFFEALVTSILKIARHSKYIIK